MHASREYNCDACRAVARPDSKPRATDACNVLGVVVGWDGFVWQHPTEHSNGVPLCLVCGRVVASFCADVCPKGDVGSWFGKCSFRVCVATFHGVLGAINLSACQRWFELTPMVAFAPGMQALFGTCGQEVQGVVDKDNAFTCRACFLVHLFCLGQCLLSQGSV